jgi:hypothetical protein
MLGVENDAPAPRDSWKAIVSEVSPLSGNTFEVVVRLLNSLTTNIPLRIQVPIDLEDHQAYIEEQTRAFVNSAPRAIDAKINIVPGLVLDLKEPIVPDKPPDPKLGEFSLNLSKLRKIERNPNLDTGLDLNAILEILEKLIEQEPRFLDLL